MILDCLFNGDVGHCPSFPVLPLANFESVEAYQNDLRGSSYIKSFRCLSGREPIYKEIRENFGAYDKHFLFVGSRGRDGSKGRKMH